MPRSKAEGTFIEAIDNRRGSESLKRDQSIARQFQQLPMLLDGISAYILSQNTDQKHLLPTPAACSLELLQALRKKCHNLAVRAVAHWLLIALCLRVSLLSASELFIPPRIAFQSSLNMLRSLMQTSAKSDQFEVREST